MLICLCVTTRFSAADVSYLYLSQFVSLFGVPSCRVRVCSESTGFLNHKRPSLLLSVRGVLVAFLPSLFNHALSAVNVTWFCPFIMSMS
jgi:hypothetical protein